MKAPMRPDNVGTLRNLPADVCVIAQLERRDIIAWTTLDNQYDAIVGNAIFFGVFGTLLWIPCLWPYLLAFSPCLYADRASAERLVRNTYWILTNTDLKIVTKKCDQAGDIVNSIPLENITECGATYLATGCCGPCSGKVPTIYVDTASHIYGVHEADGYGLVGYDWFLSEILNRRDIVKGTQRTIVPKMDRK
jgi:hypothetical protein